MNSAPLLIVVTGPDGSGKSTACEAVRERLAREPALAGPVLEVSVWDAMKAGQTRTFQTKAEAEAYLADLDGPSRTLFIFHALSRALQLALRAQPAILILNGYWFKYAVSELGYGGDRAFVLGSALAFPRPDLVICLDIDPETAWRRRQRATGYEQGGGAESHEGGAEARFLKFQTALRPHWDRLEAFLHEELPWTHLSAALPPARIVDEITGRISRLAAERRAHDGQ